MDELAGAVETVVAEKSVDKKSLFALTNSEGGIHAVNYQLQARSDRFKGLVLTGAPGRAIGALSCSQILYQAKSLPNADFLMSLYDKAIKEFLASEPIVIDPALPEAIRPFLRALENPTNLPFARELWGYSLPEYLAKVDEPMLVVIGKRDIQIDWRLDGGALEKATSQNAAASFVYPEYANHVLKHEEMPVDKLTAEYVGAHYNAAGVELDGEAVSAIFDWLDRRKAIGGSFVAHDGGGAS